MISLLLMPIIVRTMMLMKALRTLRPLKFMPFTGT